MPCRAPNKACRLLACLLLPILLIHAGPLAAQDNETQGEDGRRVYTPEDFQRYAPRTALEMLQQVPGFVIREQIQERGLGQATGNVLINGQRMSGKSNEVIAELGRIPAGNVVRIEVVDGATLDISGLSGLVANINLLYRRIHERFEEDGLRSSPDQVDRERQLRGKGDGYNYEVGADYEFGWEPGRLKLIGLTRQQSVEFSNRLLTRYAGSRPDTGSRFDRDSKETKHSARGEYRLPLGRGEWQWSAETAFNRLDSTASLFEFDNGQFQPIPLPGAAFPIPPQKAPPFGQSRQLTGDGGNFDNTGILPLLLRRVPKITAFLNSDQQTEWSDIHGVPIVAEMLPPLFGYQPYSEILGYERYPSDSSGPLSLLRVFEPDQFHPLIKKLWQAFKDGKTAMWKGNFQIDPTNGLNIDYGGTAVTILWVYNNPVRAWTDRIAAPEVRKNVNEGEQGDYGPLPYFPNYSTGFEDFSIWNPLTWNTLGNLSPYQVTMLADLSHWNVTTDTASPNGPPNREVLKSMF